MRGTLEAFLPRLLGEGVTRPNALEALVISGWVRGLSMRDIEAGQSEMLGPDAALSKSTVSAICAENHARSSSTATCWRWSWPTCTLTRRTFANTTPTPPTPSRCWSPTASPWHHHGPRPGAAGVTARPGSPTTSARASSATWSPGGCAGHLRRRARVDRRLTLVTDQTLTVGGSHCPA